MFISFENFLIFQKCGSKRDLRVQLRPGLTISVLRKEERLMKNFLSGLLDKVDTFHNTVFLSMVVFSLVALFYLMFLLN